MTGFSVVPLQLFSMLGLVVSLLSGALFAYLIYDRIVHGPDVQGVFTLFAIVFFLLGIALSGIGLMGEYVGRIYEQVRGRPRYMIAAVLDETAAKRANAPAGGAGASAPVGASAPSGASAPVSEVLRV